MRQAGRKGYEEKRSAKRREIFLRYFFFSPRTIQNCCFLRNRTFAGSKNPVTLNEKLLKLKLEEYRDSELVRKCADKYRVREYVRERGLESCLNAIEGGL